MPKKLDHPLRYQRQRAGVTQSGLAREIGVTRGAITAIEEGRTRMPTAATLSAAEEILGLSQGELRPAILGWLAAEEDVRLSTNARAVLNLTPRHLRAYPHFTAWRREIVDTPTAFASLLRVNQDVVLRYEQGKNAHGMSDRLAGAILKVLGVDAEYLSAVQGLPVG